MLYDVIKVVLRRTSGEIIVVRMKGPILNDLQPMSVGITGVGWATHFLFLEAPLICSS